MSYHRIAPHPALADLVEYFGIQESKEQSSAVTQVLPTNQLDLLIHFGDLFLRHGETGQQVEPRAHLCGQRTQPFTVSASGDTGILMCSFFPWAVYELTGVPVDQLTNDTVPAEDIFPGIGPVLREILEADDLFARVKLLETYLLSLPRTKSSLVRAAAETLKSTTDKPIHQVAASLGLSKRQLDRKFISAVGISPKSFARVIRFQRALGYRHTKASAANIAIQCGYFDQAHMHRELKALGGQTPGKLLKHNDSTPLLSRFNVYRPSVSRFYNTLYLQ